VFQRLKITGRVLSFVIEPTLEAENVIAESTTAKEEKVQFLEHEIECPRCHDSMLLYSEFDNLYYVCEECDFFLYTIKK
jgi:Zn finger protein HypA/HybF involved in hydrogenase expression